MRRMLILLLLFALACGRPVMVENPPGPQPVPRGGGAPPVGPAPPRATVCSEVSRIPCDFARCGPHMDYVTLNCPTGVVRRCEANMGCKAGRQDAR